MIEPKASDTTAVAGLVAGLIATPKGAPFSVVQPEAGSGSRAKAAYLVGLSHEALVAHVEGLLAGTIEPGASHRLSLAASRPRRADPVADKRPRVGPGPRPEPAGAGIPARGPAPTASVLSRREGEVLQLFADCLTQPEVAARLFISVTTVKNHLRSIYAKLGARDRTQAVVRGLQQGIVRIELPDEMDDVFAVSAAG